MKWILLWVFLGGNGAGTATAEFNTKEACEVAAAKVQSFEGVMSRTKTACVPKGEEQ